MSSTALATILPLMRHVQLKTMADDKRNETFIMIVSATAEFSPVNVKVDNPAVVKEFNDVFADMPLGLPPDRGVGYTITFADSSPVFKPMHSLSLREKQQVKGLLARGLIRILQSSHLCGKEGSCACASNTAPLIRWR